MCIMEWKDILDKINSLHSTDYKIDFDDLSPSNNNRSHHSSLQESI